MISDSETGDLALRPVRGDLERVVMCGAIRGVGPEAAQDINRNTESPAKRRIEEINREQLVVVRVVKVPAAKLLGLETHLSRIHGALQTPIPDHVGDGTLPGDGFSSRLTPDGLGCHPEVSRVGFHNPWGTWLS